VLTNITIALNRCLASVLEQTASCTSLLAWLSVWGEVQICIWPSWCHCHSLSLASVKTRLVHLWYWVTRIVPKSREP